MESAGTLDERRRDKTTAEARVTAAAIPPLLSLRTVRALILSWTIAYGSGSWLLEWVYSRLGARPPMAFMEGSKAAVYAIVWAPVLVLAVWLTDRWPVRSLTDWPRVALHAVTAIAATFAWGAVAYFICVTWVPGWTPWGVGRMYLNTANGVLYVYAVVVVICHIVNGIRQNREREVAAVRAAEAATQAQLQVLSMEAPATLPL